MQTHIEIHQAQSMIYMRQTGAYGGEQNFQLMERMKLWLQEQKLWEEAGAIYGIPWDDAAITPPDECRYDVCVVTEREVKEAAVHRGELPSGAYLVATILHTSEEIQRFWLSIADIMDKEKRQLDDTRPILERYQIDLVDKGYCELCLPIRS